MRVVVKEDLLVQYFQSASRRAAPATLHHCFSENSACSGVLDVGELQAWSQSHTMSSLVKHMFGPLWSGVATRYRKAVFSELSQYGLRYDDLYDPLKDEDVAEALRRLPPDVIVARNCRLRRAADLDLKHDHLHGELLAKQTPGEHYLQEVLEEVRKERRERAQLGTQPAYTRIYY